MSGTQLEEWIRKAESDYRAAMALDVSDLPDVICYHCQQCIEEYLKAALIAHGQRPPWIHDLTALNEAVETADSRFAVLTDQMDVLNPYSVVIRYPGADPFSDDAREARETMHELRTQIRELLELDPAQ